MASLRTYKPLRLMAGDAEDLGVLSAHLQDAVAKLGDFAYQPGERRFAFVANRFLWECVKPGSAGPFARVRTGVHFEDVRAVQFNNLRLEAKEAVVELLAMRFEAGEDGTGVVTLDFSGGGAARLEVESVNAYLADISVPWRTRAKPSHDD